MRCFFLSAQMPSEPHAYAKLFLDNATTCGVAMPCKKVQKVMLIVKELCSYYAMPAASID